ncbi:MAG: efflux RND transporter periplasmic adaptor subunit [Pseudomonadota bacterium]
MKKIIYLSVLALLITSCDSKKSPPPAPSVVIENPVTAQITPYLTETGNLIASNSIDLVARVSGYLESYNFTDGSLVKKGDLLFVIQPQPYADDVVEAQATLDSDNAAYAYDKIEYERQLKMYKQHATPLAEVQKWSSTTDEAAAAVEGAKANLANAKVTYSYTHVTAPMDGRIGRHLVDPGNLVGNGEATKLASLQQLDVMYVYFNINELDLLKLREAARKINFDPAHINEIPIEVALQDESGFPHKGYLDFASTELDASTGTIQMRGILENPDYVLLPGLFVQARIALSKPTPQLTVPSVAIMADQIGSYVYTVDANNKVQLARVTTGSVENNMTVILTGLKADDHVIVSGVQNASPGGLVTPTEKAPA